MCRKNEFIVVGGGPSGIALTLRLLERFDVILIESGDKRDVCNQCGSNHERKVQDWAVSSLCPESADVHVTQSQKGLAGQTICLPQGN